MSTTPARRPGNERRRTPADPGTPRRRATTMSAVAIAASIALSGTACGTPIRQAEATPHGSATTASGPVTEQTVAAFVDSFGKQIADHWPQIATIWPGADYTKHVAVSFHLDDTGAVRSAWASDSAGTRKLSASEQRKLTPPPAGGYSPGEFDGRTAVLLSFDDKQVGEDRDAAEYYRLATHELVHFYHQDDLAQDEAGGSRSQPYPIAEKPRLLREMTYDNLVKAVQQPGQATRFMRQAAYWYEQWKREFADEYKAIRTTDIAEGHARYVENLGFVQTAKTTPAQVRAGALTRLQTEKVFGSAEAESYEIGFVASLLLDDHQPGWKKTFLASKRTQADVLLDRLTPLQQKADPQIEKNVADHIAKTNREIKTAIAPLEAAQKDTKVPYLTINGEKSEGSFSGKYSIRLNGVDITTSFSNTYRVGSSEVRINRASIMMSGPEVTVPLPANARFAGGKLSASDKQLSLRDVPVTKTTGPGGRTVYTVTATG